MAKIERKVDYKKEKKRLDGRKMDELRPIKVKTGVIDRADGSAYVEWGRNKAIATVYGPQEVLPRHLTDPYRAVLVATYRMAPFSVSEHKNSRPGRRDYELSKVIGEALSASVFLEKFPKTMIKVDVQIFDANAGTRITALTAASVALADAGIPMKGLVAGTAVGKAFGELLIDLTKDEEDAPDAVDMTTAFIPATDEIVLLQIDGLLKFDEWKKCLDMASKASKNVERFEKESLLSEYAQEGDQ